MWPAHGRSSDWLMWSSEVAILNLLAPADLESIAGGQHAVSFAWWGLQHLQNSSRDTAQSITFGPCVCVC